MGRSFLDTHVLLYADDASAPSAKRATAQEVLVACTRDQTGVVSTQVLQEFAHVALRKLHMPPSDVLQRIQAFSRLAVVEVHVPLLIDAVGLVARHRLSLWDALIVRSAVAAGCTEVLTEDLNHGQRIDGVRVVNPFRGVPARP
ncbi:PIN domain-containing protein [Myxococcota bacterium]|nr:PIN domain-containing protein [Myxococcota bacterium]